MQKFATENNIIKLLPFFKEMLPNFYVFYVWDKSGKYGYHLDNKLHPFDAYNRETHFDIFIKNDFEFEVFNSCTRVNLKRFNRILRLGLTAVCGFEFKKALDEYYDYLKYELNNTNF